MADLSGLRILISNDDGIASEGIAVLEAIARTITDDVWVCAPDVEHSACGHSVTIHDPVRLTRKDNRHFSISGTPADCVFVGIHHLLEDRRPDLVISGINVGMNLGTHVSYSGTVAAAKEATVLGIPAIAFSQQIRDWGRGPRWDTARRFLPGVLHTIVAHGIEPGILFNVNFPDVLPDEVTGTQVAPLGVYDMEPDLQVRTDPRGREYFWIGADFRATIALEGTDIAVVAANGISVTPLSLDATHHSSLDSVRSAFA